MTPLYRCAVCDRELPSNAFRRKSNGARMARCRECEAKRKRDNPNGDCACCVHLAYCRSVVLVGGDLPCAAELNVPNLRKLREGSVSDFDKLRLRLA